MNSLQRSQRILMGLAIGVVLALLIAPETRWLARDQLAAALFIRPINWEIGFKDEPPVEAIYGPIAQRNPNDYQIQLAYTYRAASSRTVSGFQSFTQTGDPRVAALRSLESRFGDNPSLYGNILRLSCASELRTGYHPEDWLIGGEQPPANQPPAVPSSALVLAEYDHDAAMGEKLDPENAYFPLMRALGLIAANKEDQAMAAVLRAGRETKFDDYSPDDVEGQWKLNEAMVGGQALLPRLAIQAALLFPHYAIMREVARIGTYKAIVLEQSGQTDQALAIRNALMHIGSLMRVQSHSIIGTLVGIAISRIAISRPDGSPIIKSTGHESTEEIEREHVDKFCAYLSQIGHSDEIPWVRAESDAGEQARAGFRQVFDGNVLLNQAVRTAVWWAIDQLLLWGVFWLLVLGGLSAIAARTAPICSGQGLSTSTRWGIGAASVLAVTSIIAGLLTGGAGWYTFLVLIAVVPIWAVCIVRGFQISVGRGVFVALIIPAAILFIWGTYVLAEGAWPAIASITTVAVPVLLAWLLAPRWKGWFSHLRGSETRDDSASHPSRWPGVVAFIATLVLFFAMFGLALLQTRPLSDNIQLIGELVGVPGLNQNSNGTSPAILLTCVAVAVIIFLVALPGGVMAVVGLVRKEPVSVALTQGYRNWSVPLSCLLLIAYGPLVLATVAQERAGNYILEQTLQHEGAYYMEIAGKPWPGPVPEPDPSLATQ